MGLRSLFRGKFCRQKRSTNKDDLSTDSDSLVVTGEQIVDHVPERKEYTKAEKQRIFLKQLFRFTGKHLPADRGSNPSIVQSDVGSVNSMEPASSGIGTFLSNMISCATIDVGCGGCVLVMEEDAPAIAPAPSEAGMDSLLAQTAMQREKASTQNKTAMSETEETETSSKGKAGSVKSEEEVKGSVKSSDSEQTHEEASSVEVTLEHGAIEDQTTTQRTEFDMSEAQLSNPPKGRKIDDHSTISTFW